MKQGVVKPIKPSVVVSRLTQDHVCANDTLFNTNNLWADQERSRPDDYKVVLHRGSTKNWVSPVIKTLDLDAEDTRWMLKAAQIGLHTGRHSKIFDEELEKTLAKYTFPPVPDGSPGWFVRTERVSLKYGEHKAGPYTSLRQVLQSVVSSIVGHECISPDDNLESFRLYFFPWKEIEEEFRVFVYQNRITAISTQHYSGISDYLAGLSDEDITNNVVYKILDYFEAQLKHRLENVVGPNYTMDIAFLSDGSVYFIEPNSFGEDYAAGSAAFNWVYDHDAIYASEDDPITFKFIDREF